MKPRVVIVGPVPPLRGGIAAHGARLYEAFGREGLPAALLTYSRLYPRLGFPGSSPFHHARAGAWEAGSGDLLQARLDTLSPPTWRRVRAELAGLTSRDGPPHLLVQWWHPIVCGALLGSLRGVPPEAVTVLCHNVLPHDRFPLAAAAARALLGRAGRILCHSRAVADQVLSLLPRARVVTVPLPPLIDPEQAGALPVFASQSSASSPGVAGPPPAVALMAGHLRPYKGVDVLVQAWAARPDRAKDGATLMLVGESYLRGRALRSLREALRADPSIVFVDRYVEDQELLGLLRFCRVLVVPYRECSQSGLLPLARALGVPCVVSDAGGLCEQAPEARVVRSGDAAALATALQLALVPGRPPAERVTAAESGERFRSQWRRVVEVVSEGLRP